MVNTTEVLLLSTVHKPLALCLPSSRATGQFPAQRGWRATRLCSASRRAAQTPAPSLRSAIPGDCPTRATVLQQLAPRFISFLRAHFLDSVFHCHADSRSVPYSFEGYIIYLIKYIAVKKAGHLLRTCEHTLTPRPQVGAGGECHLNWLPAGGNLRNVFWIQSLAGCNHSFIHSFNQASMCSLT